MPTLITVIVLIAIVILLMLIVIVTHLEKIDTKLGKLLTAKRVRHEQKNNP